MDLAQRITNLEHVESIKELKYRYWRACDGKDPAGFRSVFIAQGARIDYDGLGRFDDAEPMAAIFAKIALYRIPDGRYAVYDMHHGMHPEITLTGDGTATGRWTLRFRQVNLHAQTETVATGEYVDEYMVEDGTWKISACTFVQTWSMTRPLAPEATVGGFAHADEVGY